MAHITKIVCKSARRRLRGLAGFGFLVSALLFSGGLDLPVQSASTAEYQLKAAFVYNFSQFVVWPAGSFSGAQSQIVIAVVGDDPFGGSLEEIVRGQKANNHPLVVQRFRQIEEIKTCHILFVSRSEAGRLNQIVATLRSRNILTVSDIEGFAQHGGMIAFVTENNRIRFKINLGAVKAGNLTISSKLLRVAEIVTP
jgi:hypothetical protein